MTEKIKQYLSSIFDEDEEEKPAEDVSLKKEDGSFTAEALKKMPVSKEDSKSEVIASSLPVVPGGSMAAMGQKLKNLTLPKSFGRMSAEELKNSIRPMVKEMGRGPVAKGLEDEFGYDVAKKIWKQIFGS